MTILSDARHEPRTIYNEASEGARFLYDGLPADVRKTFNQAQSSFRRGESGKNAGLLRQGLSKSVWALLIRLRTQVAFILVWMLVLWWGERLVFQNSVSKCDWDSWEQWPSDANPHHAVLLADPQLVDPHTYPGRPWPLSTFTIWHTDQYLGRAFSSIQQNLAPDSAIFLGDLFDGGREWATGSSQSPEKQYRKYKGDYWVREFIRFSNIFFEKWNLPPLKQARPYQDRKFLASLPGNHDLGFGSRIQLPVRERFSTYFGKSNRVDIIGNHTFVSMDTVSLEAKSEPVKEGDNDRRPIWLESQQFLNGVMKTKTETLERALRIRHGKPENKLQSHVVFDWDDPEAYELDQEDVGEYPVDVPTVLLTHVPLYRDAGTPCGPLRERWPPSKSSTGSDSPLEKDDRNAIQVAAGYQYQNVLFPEDSKELIEKIGNVEHVFSGDDHDYCEVVHRGYTSRGGGIREITVKSMSWAMGVRKPGFLLVSLWNPIDEHGNSLRRESTSSTTLQTHLCLLPDQLGIFTRYGHLVAITLVVLAVQAFLEATKNPSTKGHGSNLPLGKIDDSAMEDKYEKGGSKSASSSNSLDSQYANGLAARSNAGRTRSTSPAYGYAYSNLENAPASEPSNSTGRNESSTPNEVKDRRRIPDMTTFRLCYQELVIPVAGVGFLWYLWLSCSD